MSGSQNWYDEYAEWTSEVAKYPMWNAETQQDKNVALTYLLMAMGGEMGEVQNEFKKFMAGRRSQEDINASLVDELGDVFYYLVRTSITLGVSLEEIAKYNRDKLEARHSKTEENS